MLVASDPAAPFGCTAKVADFGLSRALALGASHLMRTRSTVTHMAPELLASGHLRQASDVYSFAILRGCLVLLLGSGWAGLLLLGCARAAELLLGSARAGRGSVCQRQQSAVG